MSELGQKRKCPGSRGTSVLPSGADTVSLPRHVRSVPISEVPDATLWRRQKQWNYSRVQSDRRGTDVWMRAPWDVRQRRYSVPCRTRR